MQKAERDEMTNEVGIKQKQVEKLRQDEATLKRQIAAIKKSIAEEEARLKELRGN